MPWGKFWRLLNVLRRSSDSRYSKAQRDDPMLSAEIAAELPEELPAWKPPLADWTVLHEIIQIGNDRLGEIAALLADMPTAVKQRHSPPARLARPMTALDRAIAEVQAQRDEEYDARIDDFVSDAKARWREMQEAERALGNQ